MPLLRSKKLILKLSLMAVLVIVLLKMFFFNLYEVSSSSMLPTIRPNDLVVTSKFMGLSSGLSRNIKRGDIVVFDYPDYTSLNYTRSDFRGHNVIKRCYSLPGDTVLIKRKHEIQEEEKSSAYYNESGQALKVQNLFPSDQSLNWSLSNYGPLYVPAAGQTIKLTKRNIIFYKDIFLFENSNVLMINDGLYIDGRRTLDYTFKKNYYFMLGDNFFYSLDSRYWGFVPEENITGKFLCVIRI